MFNCLFSFLYLVSIAFKSVSEYIILPSARVRIKFVDGTSRLNFKFFFHLFVTPYWSIQKQVSPDVHLMFW